MADLIAFLATLLRGAQLASQSLVVGGLVFVLALARPLAPRLGPSGTDLLLSSLRWTRLAALGLLAMAGLNVALGLLDEITTLDLSLGEAIGADFIVWQTVMAAAALVLAIAVDRRAARLGLAVAACLAVLTASLMSGHAAARIDDQGLILAADFLHQAGAGAWIGGIPFLLLGLTRIHHPTGRILVGGTFSRIAIVAVACLVLGAGILAWRYVGSLAALEGTAYGAMMLTKAGLLGVLLLLGLLNYLTVGRAAAGGDASLLALRRFAEAEIGIGMTVMFVAASLATQPPAIDQMLDPSSVATAQEIIDRMTPQWPRLSSPPVESLSLHDGGARMDATEAADQAWSEFNHHWAGLFVLAIGLLAVAERKARWARHWPLMFLGLAAMLFVRSDPESWPLGPIPFFERLFDPEVLQHRLIILLIVGFALFEWAVRVGRLRAPWARLVFPLICALGGALLLAHNHSLSDVKQRYLIELTHLPMGAAGIVAGWARWLQLRSDGRPAVWAGRVWPFCFILIGLLLINYREA